MPAKRELPNVVTALAWLVTAAVAIVPLAAAPDLLDRFRIIKESITRAEAFLGIFLVVVAVVLGSADRLREMLRERAVIAVAVAGLLWAGIATLASSQRMLSAESFLAFVTSIIVFFIAWYAAPRVSLVVLDLLVPAVMINVAVSALQEYGIWNPFRTEEVYRHLTATALIGNPNIVGTYMALAAMLFAPAALRVQGVRRWLYALAALCAMTGVLVSRTRTAVIALVAGLALLAIGRSWKRALVFACVVIALAGLALTLKVRVVRNILLLPQRISTQGLENATSGRVTPAIVALRMFRDHPVTGVGPGAFKYEYMAYQVRVRGGRPYGPNDVRPQNFGEAHNDHLQLLAEAGIIGYLLFLAAVAIALREVRRGDIADERAAVARGIAIPFAVTLLVLCLAQFPLHVAVTRQLVMTMAGLVMGWSRR